MSKRQNRSKCEKFGQNFRNFAKKIKNWLKMSKMVKSRNYSELLKFS